jgi:N utilization substance protein B
VPTGRRSARRQAVFVLYQQDLLDLSPEDALKRAGDLQVDGYATELILGVARHRAEIDGLLERHVEGWSLQRLGVLERAILRVAAYELLWQKETPAAVVIDEAVGSAKRFCSDEASSLVNGVLGALADATRSECEGEARQHSDMATGTRGLGEDTA